MASAVPPAGSPTEKSGEVKISARARGLRGGGLRRDHAPARKRARFSHDGNAPAASGASGRRQNGGPETRHFESVGGDRNVAARTRPERGHADASTASDRQCAARRDRNIATRASGLCA